MLKYFLDFRFGFSLTGEAISMPSIANFDNLSHFKDQNTHFAHWSTVFRSLRAHIGPHAFKKTQF